MNELKFQVGDTVLVTELDEGGGQWIGAIIKVDDDDDLPYRVSGEVRTRWLGANEVSGMVVPTTVTAEEIEKAMAVLDIHRYSQSLLEELSLKEKPREKYVRVVLEVPLSRWNTPGAWNTPGYVVSHEEFEK